MLALNCDDYAENLNTNFRVTEIGDPLDLELTEAKQSEIAGNNRSFSLTFRGGKDRFLPQGLYNLEHPSLESGTIFLVPIGEDETGYLYEAVFNRMQA